MKDYYSFLMNVAELLKTQDKVDFIVNGITVSVAWQVPNAQYTEIHIEKDCDESSGVIFKLSNTEEAKRKLLEFDKSDYFNQNLITPLILDYDEMMEVLFSFVELEKMYTIIISKSLYPIIEDKK